MGRGRDTTVAARGFDAVVGVRRGRSTGQELQLASELEEALRGKGKLTEAERGAVEEATGLLARRLALGERQLAALEDAVVERLSAAMARVRIAPAQERTGRLGLGLAPDDELPVLARAHCRSALRMRLSSGPASADEALAVAGGAFWSAWRHRTARRLAAHPMLALAAVYSQSERDELLSEHGPSLLKAAQTAHWEAPLRCLAVDNLPQTAFGDFTHQARAALEEAL